MGDTAKRNGGNGVSLLMKSVSTLKNGGSDDFIKRSERFDQKVRTSAKTYPLTGWIKTIDDMGKMNNKPKIW